MQLAGGCVVDHCERTAAETRRLRLDEPQAELRCDGRIYGGATLSEHLAARPGAMRTGSRNHVLPRDGERVSC